MNKKIALITGANRGIGLSILECLSKNDFIVVGTSRSKEGVNIINSTLDKAHAEGFGVILDVKNKGQIQEVNKEIKSKYGNVSALINNAGVTKDNLLIRMSEDEWNEVIDTNLTSVFRVTKEIVKDMMKDRYGRIVNIGSIVGLSGNAGQTNYASTKAGILGFTKSLAKEVGSRNITVNSVAPGYIDTDMTSFLDNDAKEKIINNIPLGRIGVTSDISELVMFLASDEASYITGQTISVDGGLLMY